LLFWLLSGRTWLILLCFTGDSFVIHFIIRYYRRFFFASSDVYFWQWSNDAVIADPIILVTFKSDLFKLILYIRLGFMLERPKVSLFTLNYCAACVRLSWKWISIVQRLDVKIKVYTKICKQRFKFRETLIHPKLWSRLIFYFQFQRITLFSEIPKYRQSTKKGLTHAGHGRTIIE
jgi:hypothetical protein